MKIFFKVLLVVCTIFLQLLFLYRQKIALAVNHMHRSGIFVIIMKKKIITFGKYSFKKYQRFGYLKHEFMILRNGSIVKLRKTLLNFLPNI